MGGEEVLSLGQWEACPWGCGQQNEEGTVRERRSSVRAWTQWLTQLRCQEQERIPEEGSAQIELFYYFVNYRPDFCVPINGSPSSQC